MTLSLPRAMNANDLVRAIVTTGPLPAGARLIARLPNGEVVGTIRPYGPDAEERGGSHTIAIPKHGVRNGKVTLHLEVLEKRGGTPRAPTERELEKVELLLIPAR